LRIALLADIHGNWDALQAIVGFLEDIDSLYVLGDVIGYGPQPAECLSWLKERRAKILMGNHEAACVNIIPLEWFNPIAHEALVWTRKVLPVKDLRFIQSLPLHEVLAEGILGVHGTLSNPLEEYLTDYKQALRDLKRFSFKVCFFAHTHVAEGYVWDEEQRVIRKFSMKEGGELLLEEGKRYLVNCGSVGQPRDGDSRACFSIFDTHEKKIYVKRVHYPIEETASKILKAGLPAFLAMRLFQGR